MQISFLVIGKTHEKYLQEGINIYNKRLKNYVRFDIKTIPALKSTKNLSIALIKEKEGVLLLKQITTTDYLILLDDKGKQFSSEGLSTQLQGWMNRGVKHLKFVVGGAYGFSDAVYQRAQMKLSLSPMTFSHQMVRLIFMEQLYRAYTILKNEPYHHS